MRRHWREYAIEAWGLGTFMVSACGFGMALFHPGSPLVSALPDPTLRRVLIGIAMGLTAIAIIYSPWGTRSGAHLNPATTLAFARLGRVAPMDVAGYVLAQFAGGLAGVALMAALFGRWLAHPDVRYVATVPGPRGPAAAFAIETAMAFGMTTLVLHMVARPALMRWTGVAAGALVATYISLFAPISGMSINPARTFASAAVAGVWSWAWLYFVAPPLGMLAAAEAHRLRRPADRGCAKYHHRGPCIFCEWQSRAARAPAGEVAEPGRAAAS